MGRRRSQGNSRPREDPAVRQPTEAQADIVACGRPDLGKSDTRWGRRRHLGFPGTRLLGCSSPRLLGGPGLGARVWLSSGAPTTHRLPASPWNLRPCCQLGTFKR